MNKRLLETIINTYNKHIDEIGLTLYAHYLQKIYQEYKNTHDHDTYKYLLVLCVKGPHQRRMSWQDVVSAIKVLNKNNVLNHYDSFEDLYNTISNLFDKGNEGTYVPFAKGRLTKYDTAFHIGQILGIEPKNFVYLAYHTKKSAKFLIQENIPYIAKTSTFCSLFGDLKSKYIEDMLCIFYDIFEKDSQGKIFTDNDVEKFLKNKIRECYLYLNKEYVLKKIKEVELNNGNIR